MSKGQLHSASFVALACGGALFLGVASCASLEWEALLLLPAGTFPFVPWLLLTWMPRVGGWFLGAYVLFYLVLSCNGGYLLVIPGGEEFVWYPRKMARERPPNYKHRVKTEFPSAFGFCFWPLILLDQGLWHPSKKQIRENDREYDPLNSMKDVMR